MAVPFQKTSFASGEISPNLFGHVDLAKFDTAASTARNMFVDYRGGMLSRAGTMFIGVSPQDSTTRNPPRLIPWQFNNQQGYGIEFGELYVRFIFEGGYVISGGIPYQISSPYHAVDLPLLKFTQSADVMTLTHPLYQPFDLARLAPVSWTLTPTPIGTALINPPTAAAVIATVQPNPSLSPPTLPAAYAYEITAVDSSGNESLTSNIAGTTNGVDMSSTAGSNIVTWSPAAGARYYKVYRAPTSYNTQPTSMTNALPVPAGAIFGYVGSTFGTQFVDTNITPDFSLTPPLFQNPFAPGQITDIQMTASSSDWTMAEVTIAIGSGGSLGTGFGGQAVIVGGEIVAVITDEAGIGYVAGNVLVFTGDGTSASGTLTIGAETGTVPGVVSYFQQRRAFANTLNAPDTYVMSKPGQFTNFDVSVPSEDDDALEGTPWSLKVDGIQWMLTMPLGLLTFTGSGVQQIGAQGSFASSPQGITPTSQFAAPQSSIGCSSTVPPLQINWDVLYAEINNNNVLDLAYQIFFNIYAGTDITWPSAHLLMNHQILQWCYCRSPYRIVWAVREDGVLLSLTYLKEQEIAGWARHDTQGQVRSICTVIEPPVDALYLVVERPVATGGTAYFIERMNNRLWQTVEDCWCVDAAVQTVPEFPDATLDMSSASGVSGFATTSPSFSSGSIGAVIRAGGGIATITGFTNTSLVTGTWSLPTPLTYPNDPNNLPIPQPPGSWSLAAQATTFSGLAHLAGKQVVGLADGIPIGPLVPDSMGNVNLPFGASNVVLGLAFTPQLQSVYLNAGQPTVQGRRKAIYAATARVQGSAICQIGANQTDASTVPPATFVNWTTGMSIPQIQFVDPPPPLPYTSPGGQPVQPLFTGDMRALIQATFRNPGQVAVQQLLPLPLNVLMFVPEVQGGDLPESDLAPRPQQGQGQQRAA